jgi:hypothetical protein
MARPISTEQAAGVPVWLPVARKVMRDDPGSLR